LLNYTVKGFRMTSCSVRVSGSLCRQAWRK